MMRTLYSTQLPRWRKSKVQVCAFVFSIFSVLGLNPTALNAQEASIAQEWNEALLFSITRDFARPTVHARNLFHASIAMYDAWAAYEKTAEPYLLGRTRGNYTSPFNGVKIPDTPEEIEAARNEAISFAVYRLILHRFQNSPSAFQIFSNAHQKMDALGYDRFNTSTAYVNGGPAELGNYIAQQIINFGFTDGSNESANYGNQVYQPFNGNIYPEEPGPGDITDPNRWQAISLTVAIDQSGNVVSDPPFLSPEWGEVLPFSLNESNLSTLNRDGNDWKVFYDPGPPPYLDPDVPSELEDLWKWNFMMVSVWQSHLDPDDGVMWDISPGTVGNVTTYPTSFEEYDQFYDFIDGGTVEEGYAVNPITGMPYEPQIVNRANYARVLAEFWADGLDSETPPGHWFKIYNEIRHHPMWENKWMGEGPELDNLEMDVKSYLTIGGGMHDAAISAWSIKGYYDYVRPVSAIRYMCDMGQSSDPFLPNYHPAGAPLLPGYIELVEVGDELAGDENEHVGKVKLYTWRGPDYIGDPETTLAGVGWILGENWWPYQRPTFVTPPFAGYISGHSTFSRTAAEIFTLITGSEYFPGGMSNFVAEENEFLEFEAGPTETITLQWATYRDASDQCSLSRIWGGIHPPADDIPGRLIGMELGPQVVDHFNNTMFVDRPIVESIDVSEPVVNIDAIGTQFEAVINFDRMMNVNVVPGVTFIVNDPLIAGAITVSDVGWISSTEYRIEYEVAELEIEMPDVYMRIQGAQDSEGTAMNVHLEARPMVIDTKRPELNEANPALAVVNDAVTEDDGVEIMLVFSEPCDTETQPQLNLVAVEDLTAIFSVNTDLSQWVDDTTYAVHFDVIDTDEEIDAIGIQVSGVNDLLGNEMLEVDFEALFDLDTRNPQILLSESSTALLNTNSVGSNAITLVFEFDEAMSTSVQPSLTFPDDNPVGTVLTYNSFNSQWSNETTFSAVFNQQVSSVEMDNLLIELNNLTDLAGNPPAMNVVSELFTIDTKRPAVAEITSSQTVVADADVADGTFEVDILFEEEMDQSQLLLVQLAGDPDVAASLTYNPISSDWISEDTFRAVFNANDMNVEIGPISIDVSFGTDLAGNVQEAFTDPEWVFIDTRNPEITTILANAYVVQANNVGQGGFSILVLFDEPMDVSEVPVLVFDADENVDEVLSANSMLSGWLNAFTYEAVFDVANEEFESFDVGVGVTNVSDLAGNNLNASFFGEFFDIDLTTVSVNELADFNAMTIYPNPIRAGQDLSLVVHQQYHNAVIEIMGLDGRVVYMQEFSTLPQGLHRISPEPLADGVYLVTLRTSDFRFVKKIVVMN